MAKPPRGNVSGVPGVIMRPIESAGTPLIWIMKGAASSSKVTLFRTPLQPVAPLKAPARKGRPFWITSIQPACASVIRYGPARAGASMRTNPALPSCARCGRSGAIGNPAAATGFSRMVTAFPTGGWIEAPLSTEASGGARSKARSPSRDHLKASQPTGSSRCCAVADVASNASPIVTMKRIIMCLNRSRS